jgi:cyclopropane-fatty-acyl-phospholipid synthase
VSASPLRFSREPIPFAARSLFRLLGRLHCGRLTLELPDGDNRTFTGAQPGPEAWLEIRDWKAIGIMLRKSEIGVAECWRDGLIATRDMTAFLQLCALNFKALEDVFYGNRVVALGLRLAHALRPNTRSGAKKNIHAHYDIGNDFYALWLDPSMTYSSALFASPGQSLQAAQDAKYERILATLDVQAVHHVLEIGCGWGGFAEYAARTRGCRVTGITISRAQLAYAQERIRRAGLAALVELRFCDYRDLEGRFDRIVSIEMVEAVGERFWPMYFETVRNRLKPGGRASIQSIVIAEEAFEQYRRTSDFIREYVFPGGMLPSVERFVACARHAGLETREPFLFGRDYSETLRRWRAAIAEHEAQVRAFGFDDAFLAIWRFYLHYCEAGFEMGRIDVMQIELARG